jgi:hypothetical protein
MMICGSLGKKNKRRIAAGIMGLLLLFAVQFFAYYLAAEAGHDCRGESCPICTCMQQCEHFLQQTGAGADGSVPVVLPVIVILFCAVFCSDDTVQETLVSKKVRMND